MAVEDAVREYYRRVDAGDIEWVAGLFAENGVYDRAGVVYRGAAAIRRLYETERRVSLTHGDLQFWSVGSDVFVEGSFQGRGEDGSPRRGQFADHWTFDESGKVALRRSSLFQGGDHVTS